MCVCVRERECVKERRERERMCERREREREKRERERERRERERERGKMKHSLFPADHRHQAIFNVLCLNAQT